MGKNLALVLTGGGARGAYQAGVLKYIAENIPEAKFDILVGSSSGAINVAGIASHKGNIQTAGIHIASLWKDLYISDVFRVDFISIFRIGLRWLYDLTLGGLFGKPLAHSLVDTTPLRKLLESLVRIENIQAAIDEGALKCVAVTATEVYTGTAVTFVQSKEEKKWQRARKRSQQAKLSVEHIMASAAIPMLFPSELIQNRRYVDGCIRSTTPMGPAARLGATKIFAIGVRRYYTKEVGNHFASPSRAEPEATVAQIGALILNSLFSESLDSDVEHLERLNGLIDNEKTSAMKKIDVMVIRPSEDLGKIAQIFHSKLPLLIRYLLRGLGSEVGDSSDILSYLLFVPEYTTRLIELGYADARAEHCQIESFFKK